MEAYCRHFYEVSAAAVLEAQTLKLLAFICGRYSRSARSLLLPMIEGNHPVQAHREKLVWFGMRKIHTTVSIIVTMS